MDPTPRRRTRVACVALAVLLAGCSPTAGPEPSPTPEAGSPSPATPSPEPSGDVVPTPDEDTAVGDLAEGFPAGLLPVPDDAEILVSTYSPVGEEGPGQPYELSLNLRTALPVADVAALYRASLTAAGFTETVGTPTAGLAAESTYSRTCGEELVTVGVLDRDVVRTVTVGGRLRESG